MPLSPCWRKVLSPEGKVENKGSPSSPSLHSGASPPGEAKVIRKRFFSLWLQNDRKEGNDLPLLGKVIPNFPLRGEVKRIRKPRESGTIAVPRGEAKREAMRAGFFAKKYRFFSRVKILFYFKKPMYNP